ncbi:hypothetical protein BYT27DRAFT_7249833 [Phlegmacium glaucopus]|nr:hypothetical protein BYT27DRAFT_7249833 [Phlegmacium glaucopus]
MDRQRAWLVKDFDPQTKEKAGGRTHSSHYSLELLDYAPANNIVILGYTLPLRGRSVAKGDLSGPVQTAFLHKHDRHFYRQRRETHHATMRYRSTEPPLPRPNRKFFHNQVAANVFDGPDKLADFGPAVSAGEFQELQDVLESLVVDDRPPKSFPRLEERTHAQLQGKISRDVDSKIAKQQREYYNLKASRRSWVWRVIAELQGLEPAANEANVTWIGWLRSFLAVVIRLKTILSLTSKRYSTKINYGLTDAKSRILEFLVVGKVPGTFKGRLSTSLDHRALARRRWAKTEIKGHRKTYVGGLVALYQATSFQALKRVQTENPLILVNEVDKLGRGINGDPARRCWILNRTMVSWTTTRPVDLSWVLFVCTANIFDTIPAPPLDRMEVLEVSGYVSEEKSVNASRYLGPQAKEASGLAEADVELESSTVGVLIKYHCRESGV